MAHRALKAGDLVSLSVKNATNSFVCKKEFIVDRSSATGFMPARIVNDTWCYGDIVPLNFVGIVVGTMLANNRFGEQHELIGVLIKNNLLYFARNDLYRLYAINWTL